MMNLKKISVQQKFKMRRYAVSKLNYVGIFKLNGKSIILNKHKDIFKLYYETFKREVYYDLLSVQKEDINNNKSLEIKTKISEIDEFEYVYVIGNLNINICKIGYSKDPVGRLKSIQTGCPYKLQFILIINGNRVIEKQLHKKYKKHKSNGEWFYFRDDLKKSVQKIALTDKNLALKF